MSERIIEPCPAWRRSRPSPGSAAAVDASGGRLLVPGACAQDGAFNRNRLLTIA